MFTETGRIVYLSDIRTGVSSRTGEQWATLDVVIETMDRYPRKICGSIMSQQYISNAQLKLGESVTLQLEPRSHEFNGNWYTDLTILDVSTNGISRFVQGASTLINS